MLFSDDFVSTLPSNPIHGAQQALAEIWQNLDDDGPYSMEDYEILLEGYSLLTGMIDAGLLPIAERPIDVARVYTDVCPDLYVALRAMEDDCNALIASAKLKSMQNRFKRAFGNAFHYEFTQGDLDLLQRLINQARELIKSLDALTPEHQRRLLRRLEKLQSELHKKVSDLDRFWGLIGDAGVVLGKLGNDAKPLVDRVKEIADIVWRTQARAEELPSGANMPLLGNAQHNNDQ